MMKESYLTQVFKKTGVDSARFHWDDTLKVGRTFITQPIFRFLF